MSLPARAVRAHGSEVARVGCAGPRRRRKLAGGTRRACKARLAIALACAALATMLGAASAPALPANGNGNYTQIVCADPSSGEGLGLAGMPEGLSNPASVSTWQITTSEADCKGGRMSPGRGVPLSVGQGGNYPQGTWSALVYQAPANATINDGTIYRAERAEGANDGFMGIIQQGGEYNDLYSLPRNCCDQGDWFAGNVAARGTFAVPFSPENAVNLTISPDGGHWGVNATCDPNGNNNSSCTLASGQWEYRLFGGDISLHATGDPQASNITGPLTSDDPLRGNESVTFSATDQGPGLAYVKTLVDGNAAQSQTIDANGGRCIPVPGTDAYTWAYQVPCKTSVGGRTYSLNTATLPDGPHRVQVLIEDAAGDRSIVVDRTVSTENAAPASTASPASTVAAPSPSSPAASLVLSPALGAANGNGASETAQVHIPGPGTIVRSFAHRALTISGTLLNDAGAPIGGASLDVREQVEGSAPSDVIARGTSAADGGFTVNVPPGPSRRILVGYRGFSTDPGYSSQAAIQERVAAGVQMHIAPRRTSPTGTIRITGRVAGPVPPLGVVVELLVHYRGTWEPFRVPRTDANGHFSVVYQFQGAVGRFPFRAEILSGQARFPYDTANSATVTVSTS